MAVHAMTKTTRSSSALKRDRQAKTPAIWCCGTVLVLMWSVLVLIGTSGALAHIKNDETQFPDIDFSKARFDIVLLAAAGVIPETPVFEPDRPLQRRDLAVWLALGKGAAEGGENPDVDGLAKAALKAGLIESLDGAASFGDIDRLFFNGAIASGQPASTPTRAEAASYLARHLGVSTDGMSLLQRRGLSGGPTGIVTRVTSNPGDDGDMVYVVAVGDVARPFYAHGRVARGPADLLAWEGRTVSHSLMRTIDGRDMWTYLEAQPFITSAAASSQEPPRKGDSAASGRGYLLYGLVAAIVLLGAGLFFRGKRAG